MSLGQQAARGVALVGVTSYANMGLGIVYGIVMARLLEPEDFGAFALGLFFAGLLDLRGKLGLDYAFTHRQPTTGALVATHWLLQVGSGLISVLVAGVAALLLVRIGGYPPEAGILLLAIASAMLLEAAGSTARAGMEKELALGRTTLVVTGCLFVSYAAGALLALAGARHWALVGQLAVSGGLSSLGFWWAYRGRLGRPAWRLAVDVDLARWMLRFGGSLALGALATTVLLQFDNFLVGTLVGAAALGYYTQAYKVAQWPTGLVTHIISRAAMPTYAQLQSDRPRLSRAFSLSLWAIVMLATPIVLALFAAAPDFIRLLFGEKWLPSASLLRWLIAYSLLRPLLDDTGALFTAIGQPRRITLVLIAQAVTLVVAAPPLTLAYGAVGTAIGVGLAFAAGMALTYRFVSQTLSIKPAQVFLPAAAAAAVSLAVFGGLTRLVDLELLPLAARVAVKGGAVAAVFLAVAFVIQQRIVSERMRYLWGLLWNRPA